MPRKADIANAANKEWRTEHKLVGQQLDANQKRTLDAFIDTRWREAQDSPPSPVEPIDPELKPKGEYPCTADVATLGTCVKTHRVMRKVDTGRFSDNGKPITTIKPMYENVTERIGLLTVKDAHTLGTQDWAPMRNKTGQYTCIVQGRRFTINPEDYVKLCKMQS